MRTYGFGSFSFCFLALDYRDYLDRMNTHTYEIVDSLLRHPLVSKVDVWGPGWNGWDNDIDIGENVRRRMWRVWQLENTSDGQEANASKWSKRHFISRITGASADQDETRRHEKRDFEEPSTPPPRRGSDMSMKEWLQTSNAVPDGCPAQGFDLVWTISDIFKQHDKRLSPMPCGALLAQQIGDCHSLNCFKEWYPYTSNITVTKYAFEMLEIFNPERLKQHYPDMDMHLFGHSPDSANEWDFFPIPWEQRQYDARVFGFTGSFYPLRLTVTETVKNGDKQTLIEQYDHPGYTIAEDPQAYQDPLETYTLNHPYYTKHIRGRQAFAQGLRESKICVFDSSLERKMIRKYTQAFLSGCVVAGDIPTEHEEALSKFVIRLHPDWKIEQIDEALEQALDDPDELQRKAFLAFAYARKYLTNTRKISDMLKLVDDYNDGSRGYDCEFFLRFFF